MLLALDFPAEYVGPVCLTISAALWAFCTAWSGRIQLRKASEVPELRGEVRANETRLRSLEAQFVERMATLEETIEKAEKHAAKAQRVASARAKRSKEPDPVEEVERDYGDVLDALPAARRRPAAAPAPGLPWNHPANLMNGGGRTDPTTAGPVPKAGIDLTGAKFKEESVRAPK